MFCPSCRDEFRPGFTRCAACNVELVESLDALAPARPRPPEQGRPVAAPPMIDYCGFVSLEEAREARQRLRSARIRGEIVIRDGPDASSASEPGEEYWLRVDRGRLREVYGLLGFEEGGHDSAVDESFQCGECGVDVDADESSCPKCGASFEDA